MSIQPKVINPEVDKRWDEYVLRHPSGSIYHHSAWGKVLQLTYDHTPFYVALERTETGQFEGIVPLLLIKSWLTGKRLVSLPFTSYCDRLVPGSELENIISFALEHHPDIDYLELRFLEDINYESGTLEKQSSYVTHILELDVSLEQLFKSFHNTSVRQRIKRAEKNKLKLRMAEQEVDLWEFYELETTVRKKHGLPPQPYAFFANMWRILKPKNFLFVPMIEHKGKVIAAATVLRFKDTVYFEYSASDQNSRKLCPNQKLIWEVIKIAHRDGAKFFDFGRSSLANQSLIDFKERWRAKGRGLTYHYFPKAKRLDSESGLGREILSAINRILPAPLLKLEGRLLYPHLS